ncbi:hypothetical protein ERJ75_000807600 [Trypanosoma vivax]|nr:hypothetical protein ERJ75_000807600 [Trypanosoma vivax]
MRRQANEAARSGAMATAPKTKTEDSVCLRAWRSKELSADRGEKARRVRSDDAQRQEGDEDGRPPARETGGATLSRKERPGSQTPANGCGNKKKSGEEPELTGTCAVSGQQGVLAFFRTSTRRGSRDGVHRLRRDDLRALRPRPTRSGDKHSARGGRARER